MHLANPGTLTISSTINTTSPISFIHTISTTESWASLWKTTKSSSPRIDICESPILIIIPLAVCSLSSYNSIKLFIFQVLHLIQAYRVDRLVISLNRQRFKILLMSLFQDGTTTEPSLSTVITSKYKIHQQRNDDISKYEIHSDISQKAITVFL